MTSDSRKSRVSQIAVFGQNAQRLKSNVFHLLDRVLIKNKGAAWAKEGLEKIPVCEAVSDSVSF